MTPKIAAVDVDGVLLDCDNAFAQVASHLLGRPLPKCSRAYELSARYGVTEEEMMQTFEHMKEHPEGWGGMKALAGAIEAVVQLRALGYEIHLVTAIPEELRDLRLSCLAAYGLVPDGIHCAGHHLASKAKIVQELNATVMIDDRLKHLYEAPFVAHRVWIDHGDEQDGLVVDETVYRATSMQEWVNQWVVAQGARPECTGDASTPKRAAFW